MFCRRLKVEFSFLNLTTISSKNHIIQHKTYNSIHVHFKSYNKILFSQSANSFTTLINCHNQINFEFSIHHWPTFKFIDNFEYDVWREEEWWKCNNNINDSCVTDRLAKFTVALAKRVDGLKVIVVNVIVFWFNAVILN